MHKIDIDQISPVKQRGGPIHHLVHYLSSYLYYHAPLPDLSPINTILPIT